MIRLRLLFCFYHFNFRSLSCHINKVSKNTKQHFCFQTFFRKCARLHVLNTFGNCFSFYSNFSSFVELRGNEQFHSIHLLQFGIGIINYKINCQNVGTKTDEVDESLSSFFTTLNRKFVPNNVIKNNCDVQEQLQTICI